MPAHRAMIRPPRQPPVAGGVRAPYTELGIIKAVIPRRLHIGRRILTSKRLVINGNEKERDSTGNTGNLSDQGPLLGTSPSIWRRLLVPAEVTLAQLHDVLQAVMGWQDCHMHEFRMGRRYFGRPDPEDRLMGMPPVENESAVHLSGVLARVGA